MKFLAKLCICLLTALYLLGGHWAVLQALAWGKMLTEFSQEKTLVEAVVSTFDGDHPCQLCIQIQTSKESEQKSPVIPIEKLERLAKSCALPVEELHLQVHMEELKNFSGFLQPGTLKNQWSIKPTSPPPRV